MAVVTSAGQWPVPSPTFPYVPVFARVTPRQAVQVSTSSSALAAATATTVPVASPFTKFPATP